MTIDIMNHTEDQQLFSRIILASAVPVDIIDVVPANDATDYFEDNHAYLFDVLTKSLPLKLYNQHNACVVLPMCIFCEISADLSCDVAVYDESIYTCADILAAMQTALADERFVNAFRLNISSLFFNGADIDTLFSYSYKTLHHPIAVLDSSANLLYGKGFDSLRDDPIVSCLITDGMISHELYAKYSFSELHKKLNRSIEPFSDQPEGLRLRLRFRVMSGRNLIGQIVFISTTNQQFTKVDRACMKALSSAISMRIQSSNSEYQLVSGETLLRDLVSGRLKEYENLSKYNIDRADMQVSETYYLIVVSHQSAAAMRVDTINNSIAMWQAHFSEWFPSIRLICQHEGHMVALVKKDYFEKNAEMFRSYLDTYQLRASVSNLVSDIFSVRDYYNQCLEMLRFAADNPSATMKGNLLVFRQCFSWLVMEKVKKELKTQTYILPEWTALIEYDKEYQTQYVSTLSAYIHNNSMIAAAQALYIHKNTFIYRMEKIQNILGKPITAEDKYNLYLSELLLDK